MDNKKALSQNRLPNSRIEVADALRGIAVIGIILFHSLENFNLFYPDVRLTLPCDNAVYSFCESLLAGKMYGIFALLFGLTFYIMRDNQARKGRDFSARFAWRMLLLFLIGLVNIVFYDGDILTTYAIFGLLMIPCGYLSDRWLWVITCLLLIQPYELWQLLSGQEMNSDWMWANYGIIGEAHQQTSFWENAIVDLKYALPTNLGYFAWTGRLTQIPGLFLLGLLLGRYRLFYHEGRHLRIWQIILIVNLPLAIMGSHVDFGQMSHWLSPIVNLTILLSEVSAVVLLWYASKRFRHLLKHVCFFGQMSLSNYLLQSVFGSLVFYGWGLALYRELGHTLSLLVGISIVITQILILRLWARNHQRGPAESLWRWATWI